jgi:hypothetical protein
MAGATERAMNTTRAVFNEVNERFGTLLLRFNPMSTRWLLASSGQITEASQTVTAFLNNRPRMLVARLRRPAMSAVCSLTGKQNWCGLSEIDPNAPDLGG